jgi:hypothetical protein
VFVGACFGGGGAFVILEGKTAGAMQLTFQTTDIIALAVAREIPVHMPAHVLPVTARPMDY